MMCVDEILDMFYPNRGCPPHVEEMVRIAYEEGYKNGVVVGKWKIIRIACEEDDGDKHD